MRQLTGRQTRLAGQGFTLIELLVTMVLVLLLAGAMVFNFSDLSRGAALEEGATRLESLIRFSRAHAANTGRRVQLSFEMAAEAEEMPTWVGTVKVLWEPDPLGQPGIFEVLHEATLHEQAVNELVYIEDVAQPGGSLGGSTNAPAVEEMLDLGFEQAMLDFFMPIVFNPDGSSDSAEIKLLSRDLEEMRRATIRVEGITGAIRRTMSDPAAEGEASTDEDAEPSGSASEKRTRATTPKPSSSAASANAGGPSR